VLSDRKKMNPRIYHNSGPLTSTDAAPRWPPSPAHQPLSRFSFFLRCEQPLWSGQICPHVDSLPLAPTSPQFVFCVGIGDHRIAAACEPVGERFAVATVHQPFSESSLCPGDEVWHCHRIRREFRFGIVRVGTAKRVDSVRKLGVLWLAPDIYNLLPCQCFWRLGF